jgi:hypothetical protein
MSWMTNRARVVVRTLWVGFGPFLIVATVLAAMWMALPYREDPVSTHVEARPAPEIAKVPTERVECVPVVVYKQVAKDKLNLPPSVKADPGKRVIAATRTPADERPHTVTTLLDMGTGEAVTFDRPDPLPWLAPGKRTEAAAFLGYKDGDPALRIEARHELLRVKALRLGAVASADATATELDGFVGVGVWGSF